MVGYLPDTEALLRGGYEATLCGSRRLAPVVEDLLAGCGGSWLGKGLGGGRMMEYEGRIMKYFLLPQK